MQFITPAQLAVMFGQAASTQIVKIADAVTVAGIETQNRARVRAPVDTGALRASISTSAPSLSGVEVSIEVGPEVNYGAFVEYGTSRAGAQPYMEPSADEVTPLLEKALADLDVL